MTDRQNTTLDTAVAEIDALLARTEAADEGSALEGTTSWGRYDGLPPHITLLADGESSTLLKPIAYHRPDGSIWPVPVGAKLDGASIPRAFWTLIGSPLRGKYRDASIVHDHYCVTEERSWSDTHHMFHDAMRCSGVGTARASVMFYAVYRFGPRWPVPGLESPEPVVACLPVLESDADTLVRDVEAIITHDLNPTEIAALVDAHSVK